VALFLILIFSGCALNPGEAGELRVRFPSLPAAGAFSERPVFRVDFPGPAGEVFRVFSSPGAEVLELHVPPGRPAPLTARVVQRGRDDWLFPAGGLYPRDVTGRGELELNWQDGFAADFALRLAAEGFPLGEFNLPRFFAEIRTRGEGNPWFLDRERLTDALVRYSFRADMIKRLPTWTVPLPAPEGEWFSCNPLLGSARTGEDGFLRPGSLPAGYHRFFDSRGDGIHFQIRRDGTVIYTEFGPW